MGSNQVRIRPEIEESISREFSTTSAAVKACTDSYNKILSQSPYEYLAHLIRTMEIFVRNQKNKDYFRITVTPNDSTSDIESLAWASYSGDWYSFDIYYDMKLDEIQKRVAIAHELGHLFYDVISETAEQAERETLSTLFGIAAMLHKYQCKSDVPLYLSEEDLVSKFKLLQNRSNDILNLSGSEKTANLNVERQG